MTSYCVTQTWQRNFSSLTSLHDVGLRKKLEIPLSSRASFCFIRNRTNQNYLLRESRIDLIYCLKVFLWLIRVTTCRSPGMTLQMTLPPLGAIPPL
ncbi:hypothetical protein BV898_09587 [Hypsibius exemplaris]|uniref:Uncharacterized protein n=1 Tax=Hypsibius exemplaris TaxID=2072580 RepID=A0A1W0WM56_HYPEX|nr:hypothetical protein BV898_09587 [Hypsibius exemplaris]